jgi:hypothetical protein
MPNIMKPDLRQISLGQQFIKSITAQVVMIQWLTTFIGEHQEYFLRGYFAIA